MIHKINEPKFEPEVHDSRSQTGKRPPPAVHLQQAQAQAQANLSNNNNTKQTPDSRNKAASNQAQVAAAAAAFLAAQALPTNLPTFVPQFAQSQLASHPINPFLNQTPPGLPLVNKPTDRHSPSIGNIMSSPAAVKQEETKPSFVSSLTSKTTPPSSSSAEGGQSRYY